MSKFKVGDVVIVTAPHVPALAREVTRGCSGVVLQVVRPLHGGRETIQVEHPWKTVFGYPEVWWYSEDDLRPIGAKRGRRTPARRRRCSSDSSPVLVDSRMQWSTVPEAPVWEMADRLTKGLIGGDDPTKMRGIYGWRDMYRTDPEGTVRKYKDSLMRHLRDADWVGVMTNAAILRDIEQNDE